MSEKIPYSQVTPKSLYLNRRELLAGIPLALGAARTMSAMKLDVTKKSSFSTDEKVTPEQITTTYNNYYEFGTAKNQPAQNAKNFKTSPWSRVGGRPGGE